jgi:hypothetical protein
LIPELCSKFEAYGHPNQGRDHQKKPSDNIGPDLHRITSEAILPFRMALIRGQDFPEISDDAQVALIENGRLRILIDRDYKFRSFNVMPTMWCIWPETATPI